MKTLQDKQFVLVTPPAAIVDNAAVTTAVIDTLNASSLLVLVILGSTDIALTSLKLTESELSGSGFVDIEGAAYGVTDYPLPSSTDDNKIYAFHVDLLGRKRYIDVSVTLGDGAAGGYVTVLAVLSDLRETPTTATMRGFANEIFV